jgi:hypothetical protein
VPYLQLALYFFTSVPYSHLALYFFTSVPYSHLALYFFTSVPYSHLALYFLTSVPYLQLALYVSFFPSEIFLLPMTQQIASAQLVLSLSFSLFLSLSLFPFSFLLFPKIRNIEICDGQHKNRIVLESVSLLSCRRALQHYPIECLQTLGNPVAAAGFSNNINGAFYICRNMMFQNLIFFPRICI